MPGEASDDIVAIKELIARQFASLTWRPGQNADWDAFKADFFAGAPLYPAGRPATQQSVNSFVARMRTLQGTALRTFNERLLGAEIRVFGNVAVALAASEHLENETDTSRVVEALLLVKSGGLWRIAAQAWDKESAENAIPPDLMKPSPV